MQLDVDIQKIVKNSKKIILFFVVVSSYIFLKSFLRNNCLFIFFADLHIHCSGVEKIKFF